MKARQPSAVNPAQSGTHRHKDPAEPGGRVTSPANRVSPALSASISLYATGVS